MSTPVIRLSDSARRTLQNAAVFLPSVTTHTGVLDRTAALLIVRYR